MHKAEQCILDLLAAAPEPMYGLDMIAASGGKLKRGVIYVWLSRLQDRGLVDWTPPGEDGRRRYFLAQQLPQDDQEK